MNRHAPNVVPINAHIAQEQEELRAIQHETGLDPERVLWMWYFRRNSWLEDHKRIFCETFEERLAAATADRLFGRGGDDGIDWDRLDRENEQRARPKTRSNGAAYRDRPDQSRTGEPKNEWPADKALPYVDLSLDLTPREWTVLDRIPARNVTMLGGDGSIGKSLLLMQLGGAMVLGGEWIGTLPEQGPVLYMSCEEDDAEVRRRMEDIARHLDSTRQEIIKRGLRFLSFAGKEAILAQPDRAGIMEPTALFKRLKLEAIAQRPKLIVLDTVADIFGGKEIDRSQARQFITMLRGLAIEAGAAVVIAAHPSLQGIASNTGLSGSTAWHNSVRARMYFKTAPGDDTTLRILEVKKNNYGPVSESIVLRWRDGVYVVENRLGTLERLAAEAEVDHLFMKLLRRFTEQDRNVSDNKGPTYAPAKFAATPEAKAAKITIHMLADAMERLFVANKIKALPEGSPSRKRNRIIEMEG